MLPDQEGTSDGIAWGEWAGDGPPLLMLHGVSATLYAFSEVAAALPGLRRVAFDLRGRGRSTQDGPTGIAQHAADARGLAERLGLTRPVLVGHSLGAFAAVRAAAGWPGGVRALVILDGGVWAPWVVPEEVLRQLLATSIARLGRRFSSVDEYAAYWADSPLGLAITPERRAGLERDLLALPDGGYRPAVQAERYFADTGSIGADAAGNALFDQIDAPVLLVRAPLGLTGDPATQIAPEPVLEHARPHIRDLTVVDLAGANHYDMLEGGHAVRIGGAIRRLVDRA